MPLLHLYPTADGWLARLEALGYDTEGEAALEATVKAEAGEVRRCRGHVDELAATVSGAPHRQRHTPFSPAIP